VGPAWKEERVSDTIKADVVIVGAGVSGALAATKLAKAGVSVAMLDAGPRVDRAKAVATFRAAPARTPEAPDPDLPYAPRPTVLDPDGYYIQAGPEKFGSTYERHVGGTTRHWLGTALRLIPADFELRTRHGVGVDWPISYDDLEPWYGLAEDELGVSGIDAPELGAPRSTPYPMPPIPQSYLDRYIEEGARKIGWRVTATPQARNSVPRRGRPACCGNGSCVPICPIGAKYDAWVHVAEAERAGARLVAPAVVHEVTVTPGECALAFVRPDGSRGRASGRTLVLAAHAIETPKLMLLSTGAPHPKGLGNEHDLIGRFLMDHPIQLSWGLAPHPVYPYRGPLSTSGIEMLRDGPFRTVRAAFRIEIGNDGWSFPLGDAPTQAAAAAMQDSPALGRAGMRRLKDRFARQLRFAALTEPTPDRHNRVSLSDERDAIGIPRPLISYRTGDYASAGLRAARHAHERLFKALRANEVHHGDAPVGAGHVMGTCRMGAEPKTSVVDAQLRVHGHGNCFVLGSAVFPTVGTANPTLTIAALSLRAVEAIQRSLRGG
jgi:choline dehydrogenase-like flavoprotein